MTLIPNSSVNLHETGLFVGKFSTCSNLNFFSNF